MPPGAGSWPSPDAPGSARSASPLRTWCGIDVSSGCSTEWKTKRETPLCHSGIGHTLGDRHLVRVHVGCEVVDARDAGHGHRQALPGREVERHDANLLRGIHGLVDPGRTAARTLTPRPTKALVTARPVLPAAPMTRTSVSVHLTSSRTRWRGRHRPAVRSPDRGRRTAPRRAPSRSSVRSASLASTSTTQRRPCRRRRRRRMPSAHRRRRPCPSAGRARPRRNGRSSGSPQPPPPVVRMRMT